MKGRNCLFFVPILVLCVSLTGCWNSRELTDMLIAVGMGIDSVPGSNDYRVSFQVVNSGALSAVGGSQGGSDGLPVAVLTEQSSSLFGAIRKISRKSPRRLFFGHIQTVIISESQAQKGIDELFDFFERSHEIRLNSTVLVTRGTSAEDVLRILAQLEKITSVGISKRSRITSSIWGESVNAKVADVINGLVSPGEPVIGGIRIIGDPVEGSTEKNLKQVIPPAFVQIGGISLFKDGKLIGWLDDSLARGLVWVRNEMKGSILELSGKEPASKNVIVIVRSKTSLQPKITGGKPKFIVRIKEEGIIGEVAGNEKLEQRESIIRIQKDWAERTKEEVTAAIKKAQRESSDILGFGDSMKQHFPREWKKLEKSWLQHFADSEVEVEVEAYLRGTGMQRNSYQKEMNESETKG